MPKSLVPNQFDYAGIYVEGKRSIFRFNKPHLASFMSGMLVPMGDPLPIFPGMKADLLVNAVIRSNTMVVPPLDGIYFDTFCVWTPSRILWSHMPQFLGENDTTAWTQSSTYVYPSVVAQSIVKTVGAGSDIWNSNNYLNIHFGLASVSSITSGMPLYNKLINVLPHRGYYATWNHIFRDENYQRPVLFSKGDTGLAGEFGYLVRDYDTSSTITLSSQMGIAVGAGNTNANTALLMPVNKYHDWATSLLPEPQFGNAVQLDLGQFAPVGLLSQDTVSQTITTSPYQFTDGTVTLTAGGFKQYNSGATGGTTLPRWVADLSQTNMSTTINQLRASVMTQRYLEALARGGRRVTEYYDVIYGVKNSAAAKDYPELLSHNRYMLNVNQVVATADSSGSGWSSHLGDTGAYSVSSFKNIPLCTKDFSEFGYLHILYCVRADNRYSQAIPEHFFRSELLNEYNPFFDHIGDVAVPNYYVNMNAASTNNFGFQEAWWSIRSQVGLTVGALNKSYGSLKYWTLGEVLPSSLVTCTPGWLCFDPGVFNDVFVSAYYTYPQFILDACIHGKIAARMSAHSIPGIVGRI